MQKAKQLLVEGQDDKGVVLGLIRHHVQDWPLERELAPVDIRVENSADEILATNFMRAKLKESELETLGIMIDADGKFAPRWQRLKSLCRPSFPAIPDDLPRDGLVCPNGDGKRLGVWIMPDCASHGMLETFLRFLVPVDGEELWAHAQNSFALAQQVGCSCRVPHIDRAHIHTWLAWQDPPGERPGTALTKKIFAPDGQAAAPFVAWFRTLYQV